MWDEDVAKYQIVYDRELQEAPKNVPLNTRANGVVEPGLRLDPVALKPRALFVHQPSERRGVGEVVFPMRVERRFGGWRLVVASVSVDYSELVRASNEPMRVQVPVQQPGEDRVRRLPGIPGALTPIEGFVEKYQ